MNSETPVKDILDGEVEAENTVEIETVEDTVEEQPAAPKKQQKNRVGAMFDLLTFSDI